MVGTFFFSFLLSLCFFPFLSLLPSAFFLQSSKVLVVHLINNNNYKTKNQLRIFRLNLNKNPAILEVLQEQPFSIVREPSSSSLTEI